MPDSSHQCVAGTNTIRRSTPTDQPVAAIGQKLHTAFSGLQEAICAVRRSRDPLGSLANANAAPIETFRQTLERHRDDPHDKLRTVVREFFSDGEVILRPLSDPTLPLTNNEAERAASLGDRPPNPPRHPHRAGFPRLRPSGQRDRHLPPSRYGRVALPWRRHPRRPQGSPTTPLPPIQAVRP